MPFKPRGLNELHVGKVALSKIFYPMFNTYVFDCRGLPGGLDAGSSAI
jgi:hypothetical protein